MSERSSRKPKREHDFNVTAFRVVQEATCEEAPTEVEQSPEELTPEERHAAAVALGRLGGKKGGKARAAKLTPEQRREIAKKAAQARWRTEET
ncbi:MAG: hypothetical protein M1531_09560 [Chloroflexi bacterium]|nr:hypothetical protein [Chloroflexota bacterium]